MNTKGQMGDGFGLLKAAAIVFIVVTVLLSIGGDILADVQNDTSTSQTDATYNVTREGIDSINDLADNLTTIATVVGAVILLSFLGVRLFGNRE